MGTNRTYRLLQVDVFTERPLAGNPLAVVLAAEGLSDAEMQAIAREMNLSETTFVLPATRPDCAARVRIFSPAVELPFAGHPTLGTAFVLATLGLLPAGATRFALEEAVGPVAIELEGDAVDPRFLWMSHQPATFAPELADRQGIAAALGLAEAGLLAGAPVQIGSTGVPFLYVPLRDLETVDRAVLDVPRLLQVPGAAAFGVFVFAPDPAPGAPRVYSRMFAPHTAGIPEDPATGGASGALGAYLVRHGLVAPAAELRLVSEQGTKQGRQSFVHIKLRLDGERITVIQVGGSVARVFDGTLTLPAVSGQQPMAGGHLPAAGDQ